MAKARILVIEDDDDARMMYAIMLRSWGYEILEATTGHEGVKVAQRQKPDLILLDVMMPDIDGYTVCNKLRADPQFRAVPILFLTALDDNDDRIRAFTTGGDDFLTKGRIDYKELGVRIQAALARTQRIQQVDAGDEKSGLVVGMLSLRGGVGVSTVALNLARQAAAHRESSVMLVDLAFPVGSMGLWSGIQGPRNVVTLLSNPPREITLSRIQSFATQNVHGFSIIFGPPNIADYGQIRMESVERFIHLLQEEGYIVVVDMGRGTLPLLWQVPALCDWLAIITSADSTSRALATMALETLPQQNVDPRALLLIFNDSTDAKPSNISIGLPRMPDVFIPHTDNFQQLPEPSPFNRLWTLMFRQQRKVHASS